MPKKHNADRRHHFGKMKFKVRNWASYEAGLRRRGSLTLWVTDEAIARWQAPPRLSPGGQAHYSDMAIETALMLRLTFHLPLNLQSLGHHRQAEVFAKLLNTPPGLCGDRCDRLARGYNRDTGAC
jgi:hypothetical protein